MTRLMAYLSTLSILAFVVVFVSGGAGYPLYLLSGVAVVAICTLLVGVFRLAARYEGWSSASRN